MAPLRFTALVMLFNVPRHAYGYVVGAGDCPTGKFDCLNQPWTGADWYSLSPPPTTTPAPVARDFPDSGIEYVTINMVNSMDAAVTAAYHSAQPAYGYPEVPLYGAEEASVLEPLETKAVVIPRDFSGMAAFGIGVADALGTKWEASLVRDMGYQPNIDVSFVDGYSVPMSCMCFNGQGVPEVVSGCNIDLWANGYCPYPEYDAGRVCPNPMRYYANGPPHPFFSPCSGAAYTYPKDDRADRFCLGRTEITCCIGTKCPPGPNQAFYRK